ncbi:hypothetical protein AB0K93_21360 [Streptomyces sp. NPDC052676]|uniref:hypothetical protein n=1 Tax=Streptomyces sp. NPDC052676 TaxID=3154953 RepID=UPI003449C475
MSAAVAAAAVMLGAAAPMAEAARARDAGTAVAVSAEAVSAEAVSAEAVSAEAVSAVASGPAADPAAGPVGAVVADGASELSFTAADVRDLIQRIKADGGADTAQIAQFEAYAKYLEGKGAARFGWSTIVRKLVVAGFRHGGTWLGKVLKHVSPKAGRYASKYGNKIADAIDAVENWGEHALTLALVKSGLPYDVANDLAKAIIIVAA